MIKFRYALDDLGNLVDILDLERSKITAQNKFFSLDFHQELIPRLGKIKQKHFAHKPNNEILGNGETYLHALGKKFFYDEYNNCLQTQQPFNLEYQVQKYCTRINQLYNIRHKQGIETKTFDLTQYFTEIAIEKQDDNFTPDILLFNPTTKEKIYIEIAVTHMSTESKINSGRRILEFKLLSEADIQKLHEFRIIGSCHIARLYNFKIKKEFGEYCVKEHCTHKFNLFWVTGDGECCIEVISEAEILKTIEECKNNSIYYNLMIEEELFSYEPELFDFNSEGLTFFKHIAIAYKDMVSVKDCFICRYHAKYCHSRDYINESAVFCKFLKQRCNHSMATTCKYYKAEISHVEKYLEIIPYK